MPCSPDESVRSAAEGSNAQNRSPERHELIPWRIHGSSNPDAAGIRFLSPSSRLPSAEKIHCSQSEFRFRERSQQTATAILRDSSASPCPEIEYPFPVEVAAGKARESRVGKKLAEQLEVIGSKGAQMQAFGCER
jgi:hypothetical protein